MEYHRPDETVLCIAGSTIDLRICNTSLELAEVGWLGFVLFIYLFLFVLFIYFFKKATSRLWIKCKIKNKNKHNIDMKWDKLSRSSLDRL